MTNHLWQSTVFAAAAALLTLAFRENRAHVRFWLWFAASLKFLVPFALLLSVSSWLQIAPEKKVAPIAVSRAVVQISEPFNEAAPVVQRVEPRRSWGPQVFAGVWALGFLAIVAMRFASWMRIRAMVRGSKFVAMGLPIEARSVEGLVEPGIYGFSKPVLLLPADITARLSEEKMQAVVAHELCHVRRNDNATSAIHMLVEAVFWFYPVVWWIGARLLEEREKACDEEVVRAGHRPEAYAEAILDVCRSYTRSQLECVAGISGSDLKGRIRAILAGRVLGELNFAKKFALAGAAVVAVALPIFVGVLRAQTAAPKWEVASIKPCEGGGPMGKGGGRSGGGGGGTQGPSPDRLSMNCQPVRGFIRSAYVTFANGHMAPMGPVPPIEGGPAWIDSERYQITAKAEGTPGQEVMRGPMLAALLEDRFKLKIRRESREVPVYALTVAKGGPKLKPAEEGGCVVFDFSKPPAPPPPGQKMALICGFAMRRKGIGGASPNLTWELHGATLDDLAKALGVDLDRIVIDKTGISGKFDFYLEFAPDETTAGLNSMRGPNGPAFPLPDDPSGGTSVFMAIQEQLGLKLEAAKGPREFLVIDHIEKPTEN